MIIIINLTIQLDIKLIYNESGFVQETRHKYQGLSRTKFNVFQDHSYLIDSDSNRLSQNWECRKHSTLWILYYSSTVILTELNLRSYDLLYKRNSRTLKHLDQKSAVFQGFQGLEKPVMNFKYFQALQGPVRTL